MAPVSAFKNPQGAVRAHGHAPNLFPPRRHSRPPCPTPHGVDHHRQVGREIARHKAIIVHHGCEGAIRGPEPSIGCRSSGRARWRAPLPNAGRHRNVCRARPVLHDAIRRSWPGPSQRNSTPRRTRQPPPVGSAPRSRKFRGKNVGHIDSSSTGGPDSPVRCAAAALARAASWRMSQSLAILCRPCNSSRSMSRLVLPTAQNQIIRYLTTVSRFHRGSSRSVAATLVELRQWNIRPADRQCL